MSAGSLHFHAAGHEIRAQIPAAEPVESPPVARHDLCHLVGDDDNRAFCGRDVSAHSWCTCPDEIEACLEGRGCVVCWALASGEDADEAEADRQLDRRLELSRGELDTESDA